jgi:hypothetical protein
MDYKQKPKNGNIREKYSIYGMEEKSITSICCGYAVDNQ